METILAIVVLTAAWFIVRKIRGPLPPKPVEPPVGGGQTGDETNPKQPENAE